MSEITANVKRKALKDLWKTWRAIAEEHVRAPWKPTIVK